MTSPIMQNYTIEESILQVMEHCAAAEENLTQLNGQLEKIVKIKEEGLKKSIDGSSITMQGVDVTTSIENFKKINEELARKIEEIKKLSQELPKSDVSLGLGLR